MKGVAFRNPRNVVIVQQRAALGDRIAATALDYLVFLGYVFLLLYPEEVRQLVTHSPAISLLFYIPVLLYHLLVESLFNGKSIGKSVRQTRVMKLDGSPADIGAYLMRWLFRMVDSLFSWAVAVLSVMMSRNGQRLGDIAAGTTVIKEKPRPSIDEIWEAPAPGRKVRFPEAALLTDQELAYLKDALDRAERKKGEVPLQKVLRRIRTRIGVEGKWRDGELARTLIADHDQLMRERAK